MEYLQYVTRVRDFARKYWFDLLIAFLAAAAMLEVIATRDSTQATRWFGLPAIAILVLDLRPPALPFRGPAPTSCSRPGSRSSTGS